MNTFQTETKLRGLMVGPVIASSGTSIETAKSHRKQDLSELEKWGANVVRWQLLYPNKEWDSTSDWNSASNKAVRAELKANMKAQVDFLRESLPELKKRGMKVIVDMHTAPGSYRDSVKRLNSPEVKGNPIHRLLNPFDRHQKQLQNELVELWKRTVTTLQESQDSDVIYAYDLLNEPKGSVKEWRPLAKRIGETIQSIDPSTKLIVEPPYGTPDRLTGITGSGRKQKVILPEFRPIKSLKNAVYSVHVYDPINYTHQFVGDAHQKNVDFDESVNAVLQNKLDAVRDYQLKHNVDIYVGEFSAARWADGKHNYVESAIDTFEKYGWDWTYHAFRESSVWSPEQPSNREYTNEQLAQIANTARQNPDKHDFHLEKVLRARLSKNEVVAPGPEVGSVFDAKQYLASYDDLITAFGNNPDAAAQHYRNYGMQEGRAMDIFDEARYLASHQDLINAFGYDLNAATDHYISYGASEGRSKTLFDPVGYLNNYGDLRAAFGNDLGAATRHYIEYGSHENRTWG